MSNMQDFMGEVLFGPHFFKGLEGSDLGNVNVIGWC